MTLVSGDSLGVIVINFIVILIAVKIAKHYENKNKRK